MFFFFFSGYSVTFSLVINPKKYLFYKHFFVCLQIVVGFSLVVDEPLLGGFRGRLSLFVQFSLLNQELFLSRSGAELPSSGVGFSVHDDSLGLADESVVASSHLAGSQLSDSHRHRLTLSGDQNHFLPDLVS